MLKELEKDLALVFDTAKEYLEITGKDFWLESPTEQRKLLEDMYERVS